MNSFFFFFFFFFLLVSLIYVCSSFVLISSARNWRVPNHNPTNKATSANANPFTQANLHQPRFLSRLRAMLQATDQSRTHVVMDTSTAASAREAIREMQEAAPSYVRPHHTPCLNSLKKSDCLLPLPPPPPPPRPPCSPSPSSNPNSFRSVCHITNSQMEPPSWWKAAPKDMVQRQYMAWPRPTMFNNPNPPTVGGPSQDSSRFPTQHTGNESPSQHATQEPKVFENHPKTGNFPFNIE
jgi:hypothetical protein